MFEFKIMPGSVIEIQDSIENKMTRITAETSTWCLNLPHSASMKEAVQHLIWINQKSAENMKVGEIKNKMEIPVKMSVKRCESCLKYYNHNAHKECQICAKAKEETKNDALGNHLVREAFDRIQKTIPDTSSKHSICVNCGKWALKESAYCAECFVRFESNKYTDNINPSHYKEHPSKIECIQVTEHMNFNLGNAVKYIWRCALKGDPIEQLEKARWYVDREIERYKKKDK
jgi:hypothetical protein